MMNLIRCLFFVEAWFGFELAAAHLPGRDNTLADDICRNRMSAFPSKAQRPEEVPTPIPLELPELLFDKEGWTSRRWTEHFYAIVTGE